MLTLVRHATLLLETSVGRVLVDPVLRPADTTPPPEGAAALRERGFTEIASSHPEIA